MPELPEVETVVRTLRLKLIGLPIRRVRVLRTDIIHPPGVNLAELLANRSVHEILRRGKKIILTLDNAQRLYIHLGMTGRLTLESAGDALPHTHLIVELDKGLQLRFRDPRRFGGIWWLGADGLSDENMGPEPLTLRADQLAARLRGTRRAIKTALLDQTLIAGLGNIYADEALFAARIHPLIPANKLNRSQISALSRAIKATLNRALKSKGSTLRDYRDADGNPGEFQKLHRVYDRAGEKCRRCGTPIQRIVLGGRSTHFCPHCQPAQAAR